MATPALLGAIMLVSSALPEPSSHRMALDWEAMAERIVRQMALQPGEKVLLVAHPGEFQEIVRPLRYAVMRAGGIDLGCWEVLALPLPAGWDAAIVERSREPSREKLRALAREADVAIMLPGASPGHPEYAAVTEVLAEGRRAIHFHWRGGGAPSAIEVPGHPLPSDDVIDATYQRALLHSDYKRIAETQQRFAAALRTSEVRITTPLGTDLRFRVGDRPVNAQDGDASAARARQAAVAVDRDVELPCGAIRVAPLEESVEGTIAFPPSKWADQRVEGLKLRFAKGRVVDLSAASGKDAVEAEMVKAGEGARAFREFALGFNPELAVPEDHPWIPYYGYGSGVVRLSLGDNTELGGSVRGGYVRWNFFTDTTVTVGGRVWVKDGKLTVP